MHTHGAQEHSSKCLVKAEVHSFKYKQCALLETILIRFRRMLILPSKQFTELKAIQDLQAAQIAKLQGKLDKLESQQGPTQDESEQCLLSPAVGMNHRDAFHHIKNLPPQLYSIPASRCNQPALKSAADVIDSNQKLLQSSQSGMSSFSTSEKEL